MIQEKNYKIDKPFLRWAGGKTWLLKHLDKLSVDFNFPVYHEPFLGGGSVFFSLQPQSAILSDTNRELISTYKALKDNVNNVIRELKLFKNTEKQYYDIRATAFRGKYQKAAQFIFLNQTSFNGIYRVNLKGVYNVPYGYRNVEIFNEDRLKEISRLLQTAELYDGDFSSHEKTIKKGHLVFLDPPYTVTHNNNGFIKYNQKLFSIEDQKRLSEFIDVIKEKQAFYILTNAAHSAIETLFEKGDHKIKLKRASLIGGTNAQRGNYEEIIFTNVTGLF